MRIDSNVMTVRLDGEYVGDVHRDYQGMLRKIVL